MKAKRGFTLIELMATIAVITIALTLIGITFIQGYKILNKTENKVVIQDEVRNVIMKMELEASKSNEIKIRTIGQITTFDGKDANEVVYLAKENENIAYLEVVIDEASETNKFVEAIYEKDGALKQSKILINNIKWPESEKFALRSTKNGNLVNINFLGVSKGKEISDDKYIVTLSNKSKDIDLDVDWDLISNVSNNVNIAGSLTTHNSNDKHTVLEGSVGYIETSGWKQHDNPPGEVNSNLQKINLKNCTYESIHFCIDSAHEPNVNIEKIITKEHGEYKVYITNGDVGLIGHDTLNKSIIITSGNLFVNEYKNHWKVTNYIETIENSNEIFTINDSIIYANSMSIQHKSGLKIQGDDVSTILKYETLNGSTLEVELREILKKYGL